MCSVVTRKRNLRKWNPLISSNLPLTTVWSSLIRGWLWSRWCLCRGAGSMRPPPWCSALALALAGVGVRSAPTTPSFPYRESSTYRNEEINGCNKSYNGSWFGRWWVKENKHWSRLFRRTKTISDVPLYHHILVGCNAQSDTILSNQTAKMNNFILLTSSSMRGLRPNGTHYTLDRGRPVPPAVPLLVVSLPHIALSLVGFVLLSSLHDVSVSLAITTASALCVIKRDRIRQQTAYLYKV